MKIENQVANKEDAKKMQELGIDFGETAFVWQEYQSIEPPALKVSSDYLEKTLDKPNYKNVLKFKLIFRTNINPNLRVIPAPTVPEMIDWLPTNIKGIKLCVRFCRQFDNWNCKGTLNGNLFPKHMSFVRKTQADALVAFCKWVEQEGYK
jgi:hypothetical protein